MYSIEDRSQVITIGGVEHKPVSYTHLDVYKRQGYGGSVSCFEKEN